MGFIVMGSFRILLRNLKRGLKIGVDENMEMITSKSIQGILCFLIWMSIITKSQGAVIDAKHSGAKGDGVTDDSKAITSAWQSACSSPTPSKLVIPPGQYAAGPMTFLGPYKAPITLQFEGNLKAPTDINKLKSQDGWIIFQQIDALMLNGDVFDGQGQVAWSQNNCAQTGKCSNLPINIRFNKVTNSIVQGISSLDSKLFHMNILQCLNLTLSHITINAPANSLNTDGIHIGRSNGIKITDSDIKTGDDCISMGDGSQQMHHLLLFNLYNLLFLQAPSKVKISQVSFKGNVFDKSFNEDSLQQRDTLPECGVE